MSTRRTRDITKSDKIVYCASCFYYDGLESDGCGYCDREDMVVLGDSVACFHWSCKTHYNVFDDYYDDDDE